VCAFLVLSGSQAGRWVGIAVGAIGCISAIWWMPPYDPIWSLIYVAIGALVICVLAAYRRTPTPRQKSRPALDDTVAPTRPDGEGPTDDIVGNLVEDPEIRFTNNVRVDGTKLWSLMQLERQLRPGAYGRVRGGYVARRRPRTTGTLSR
jgi:hypothetical protein